MSRAAMRRTGACSLVIATAIAGCAVGPDFEKPKPPTVERYLPAREATAPASPVVQRFDPDRDIPADWWTLFHSPEINALVGDALAHNADLDAAEAALRVARENVAAQRGAYFPTVEANLNPTRQSVARILSSPLDSNADRFSLHTAQLSISYAPDVFGGNRRQVESLEAQAAAQRYALLAARLTLTSNLVAAAIQEASLRSQIRATRAMIASASRQLDLFRKARALGQLGASDVASQEALLAQSQALLPPLEKQLAQQASLVAVLSGRYPADGPDPVFELDALRLPGELPQSLPSRLVEQRPDIGAAAEQLHAASAQIGVAVANRLPDLTLSANGGSVAQSFGRLFSAGTGFWAVGANLVQPVFDGGTLLHRERAARAAYDQAAAQYRSTVLVAFENVADTLTAIETDARSLDTATAAESAAARSLAIAEAQREAGAGGALPVLAAEQVYGQALTTRIQAEAARYADTVALFQALGGGWWNDGK